MSKPTPLRIVYKNDEHWFHQVGPQLNALFTETSLTFDNEIGKGAIYKTELEPGLRLRKLELQFNRKVIFVREPTSHPGYFVLVANLSEEYLQTTTHDQNFKLGYGSDNGIYFSSPLLSASYIFEPGIHYHMIFLTIRYERVKNFISTQTAEQKKFLEVIIDKNKPVYHFECLDPLLMSVLKDIDKQLNDSRMNNLLLHAKTFELLHHMLQRVEQRRSKLSSRQIHHDDVAKLNKIKTLLLEQFDKDCPTINDVSKKSAMSATKFKTLFKQMFGQTYYQFYKNVRMHKAKELLEQKKMNVSEVGYLLGYNNLSKFTKAFKDVFDVTPGNYASTQL